MRENQRVPILVYHHVYDDQSSELRNATFETGAGIIGEKEFYRQLQYITDNGWTVVTTTQVVDWLTGGMAIPEKSLVLHFDNGWLDTVTVALPLLIQFKMTATCFPITDGLEAASHGKVTTVRTLTEGYIEKPFMTWAQVSSLLEAGWEVGAHTASHCKLEEKIAEEGDEGVLGEINKSNALFKRNLNITPQHFAYPSGSRNESTDKILSRFYRSLRLWHFEWPVHWSYTDNTTLPTALDCQNIDVRVSFEDFTRIFSNARSS